jgi:hypothetical protein
MAWRDEADQISAAVQHGQFTGILPPLFFGPIARPASVIRKMFATAIRRLVGNSKVGAHHPKVLLALIKVPRFQTVTKAMSSIFFNIGKVFALLAAALALPLVAYLGSQNGNGNSGHNNNENHESHGKIPSVPDNGPGIALLAASIGAVLVLSARQSPKKA